MTDTIPAATTEKTDWTQDELRAEAVRRFGEDIRRWAFVCPACGDVATVQDFIDAGDRDAAQAGQICIGRLMGALDRDAKRVKGLPRGRRGCDWAAFGLFGGPWGVVLPADGDKPERTVRSFRLAEAKS